MKLRNEGAMYFVIYISLSFNETSGLYDENDYFDSDLIPFISISTKKTYESQKTEENPKSSKTTSHARYSKSNIEPHPYVAVSPRPIRHDYSTQGIERNVLKNDVLTTFHKLTEENITDDSKQHRLVDDSLNKTVYQHSDYAISDFRRTETLDVLNETNSYRSPHTDDRVTSAIMKRNKEDSGNYSFSKFFDSLLSLLNYINPNLVNLLNTNLKRFKMYNISKRDSMSDDLESSSSMKTILCNCDYCITGKPDTVLYIVSGKKLNNNVTYHKLTSINRSKSKASFSYQQQTANDNDSYRSPQSRYLPANYDKAIFGNIFGSAVSEKVINSYEVTNDPHSEPPLTKMVSDPGNPGTVSTSANNKNSIPVFYVPWSNKIINEPLNTQHGKVIEPKIHKHKSLFDSRNHLVSNHKHLKNKGESDTTENKNDRTEILHCPLQSTEQSIEYSDYAQNNRNGSDSNENQNWNPDEAINEPTYINSNRAVYNAEVNEIPMSTSEEITETNSDHSSKENGMLNENYGSIELPGDAEHISTQANDDKTTYLGFTLKGIVDNSYLKNIFHEKALEKADRKTSMSLPRPPKTPFDVLPVINEQYNHTLAARETNSIIKMKNNDTGPLQKSIMDIFDKLLDKVEAENVNRTNHINTTTNTITLSNDGSDNSDNNYLKNTSASRYQDRHEYSTTFMRPTGLFDAKFHETDQTIVATTTALKNSVNKKETYVNYDLNLRNFIGESNIDDKIMCS